MARSSSLTSGVHVPNYGPQWRTIDLAESARLVEQLGFDSLWLSDHIVLIEGARSRYPFSADGEFFLSADADWLDWVTTAAYLAALTSTIDIGVGVSVLPLRHPLLLAKQMATLDQLSGGRVRLGVGAGWLAEEFDALGIEFSARGKAMDGGLRLLRQAWTGAPSPGDYGPYRVPVGVRCHPLPSRPALPIYVGGESPAAFRRVAQYADGWYGSAPGGRIDPVRLQGAVAAIQAQCERYQRDPDQIDIALRVAAPARELGSDEFHQLLVTYVRHGVTRLSFDVGWRSPDEMAGRLEALAKTFEAVVEATA